MTEDIRPAREQKDLDKRKTHQEVTDPDSGVVFRFVYSYHDYANDPSEIGDARAIAVEDVSWIPYQIGAPFATVFNLEELFGGNKGQYRKLLSHAKEVGMPIYFTDTYLPKEIREEEKLRSNLLVPLGLVTTLAMGIGVEKIERAFRQTLERRKFLAGALAATAGGIMLGGLIPLAELITRDPEGTLDENSMKRKVNRAAGRAKEILGIEPSQLTIVFRNIVMAYKMKYIAQLRKDAPGTHIAAPVGAAHHGIERMMKLSAKTLEKEIRKWITDYSLPKNILAPLAVIPAMKFNKETNTWEDEQYIISEFKDLIVEK